LEGNALSGLLAGPEAAPPELSQWLISCDIAVCWMADPGGLRDTLEACGVVQVAVEPASGGLAGIHQSDYLLRSIERFGRATPTPSPLLLPEAIQEEGLATLRAHGLSENRFVVIHPGSGSPHKCVGPEVLATVADGLQKRGIPVVLAVGPADEDRARIVLDLCQTAPLAVRGLDLLQMAGILANATVYVGHDSGLTHLAAALGVSTLALFGPTDPGRWAPRGTSVTVLTGSPCRCEGWESVRVCADKPCLRIAPGRILSACDECLCAPVSAVGPAGLSR
jgi:ADP-heptose:LPS heptosyltransferase